MKLYRKMTILAIITVFVATITATPFDQPFMQAALNDLKAAQNHLKNATADKGGHRQRAMDFTAGAINAVNKGIDYDRTLMSWWQRFERAWPQLRARYGERFFRMWKFYLLSSAGFFRSHQGQLWQIVLAPRGRSCEYRSVR